MTFCQLLLNPNQLRIFFCFLALVSCNQPNNESQSPNHSSNILKNENSTQKYVDIKSDSIIYLEKILDLEEFSKNFKEIKFEVQKISIEKKENFKYSSDKIDSKYNQIIFDFLKTNNRHFINLEEEFYPYFKVNIDSNRIGFAITYQVSSIADIPPVDLLIFNKKSGSFEQIIKLMETYICGSIYQVESRIEDINQDQKLDILTKETTFTTDSTKTHRLFYQNNGKYFEKKEIVEMKDSSEVK